MTDNEIIKALECRVKDKCPECPYFHGYPCDKCRNMQTDALDLINRLQAEIERLRNHIQEGIDLAKQIPEMIATAKAEAYKECIEKVKEEIAEALKSNYKAKAERLEKHNVGDKTDFISYCGGKIDCLRGLDDFLNNLLKELVGDT